MLKPQDVSYYSVYRFLRKPEMVGKRLRKEPERKRFALDKVNGLWQADLSGAGLRREPLLVSCPCLL